MMLRAAIVEADYVYSEYLNGLLLRWAVGRAELMVSVLCEACHAGTNKRVYGLCAESKNRKVFSVYIPQGYGANRF